MRITISSWVATMADVPFRRPTIHLSESLLLFSPSVPDSSASSCCAPLPPCPPHDDVINEARRVACRSIEATVSPPRRRFLSNIGEGKSPNDPLDNTLVFMITDVFVLHCY
jgi:hypothetical protein